MLTVGLYSVHLFSPDVAAGFIWIHYVVKKKETKK